MMPFISVIIPCYNSEEYIKKCLVALEQQTYNNFDVILVDDGSTDKTLEIIKRFQKQYTLDIRYTKNKKNSGPAQSRNNGIALSTAKYIAFCDSDDWYESNYLQLMAEEAQNNDADMVFCNSQKVLMNGSTAKIENIGEIKKNASIKEVLTLGIDSLCCIIVKRSIIIQIPQPNIRNGEDMAIIPLMIIKSKQFGFVCKPIYNYLCRPGSLSLSANEKVVSSLEISFNYIMEHQISGYETEIEYIGIKNVVYGALLNHFKCSSDVIRAKELLKHFENKYPKWSKNIYIKKLTVYKRLFIWFAKLRLFVGIKLLCYIHKQLTEKED